MINRNKATFVHVLDKLNSLKDHLDSAEVKIGKTGGRLVKLNGKYVSLNSIYRRFRNDCGRHFDSDFVTDNAKLTGRIILKQLARLDLAGNNLLSNKKTTFFQRSLTKIRRLFGRLFFNRSVAIKKLELLFCDKSQSAGLKSPKSVRVKSPLQLFTMMSGDKLRELSANQIIDYFNRGYFGQRCQEITELLFKNNLSLFDEKDEGFFIDLLNKRYGKEYRSIESAYSDLFNLSKKQVCEIDFNLMSVSSVKQKISFNLLFNKDFIKFLDIKKINKHIECFTCDMMKEFDDAQVQSLDFSNQNLDWSFLGSRAAILTTKQVQDLLNRGSILDLSKEQLDELDISAIRSEEKRVKTALNFSINNDVLKTLERPTVLKLLPHISKHDLTYIDEKAIDANDFAEMPFKAYVVNFFEWGFGTDDNREKIEEKLIQHLTEGDVRKLFDENSRYLRKKLLNIIDRLNPEHLRGIDLTSERAEREKDIEKELEESKQPQYMEYGGCCMTGYEPKSWWPKNLNFSPKELMPANYPARCI